MKGMEQVEEYKRVVGMINGLEQQITKCNESMKDQQKQEEEAKKEINAHFARCCEVLAARQASLLADLDKKANAKRKSLEDINQELKESLDNCKKILEQGSSLYTTNATSAASTWSEIQNLAYPQVSVEKITAVLPGSLLQTIQSHGKVILADFTRYIKAEKVTTVAGSMGGCADGSKTQAKFNMPYGICWNTTSLSSSTGASPDSLFVCDCVNNSIRKLTIEGEVSTYVPASKGLAHPCGMVMNPKDGTLYVVNNGNHTISKVSPSGEVSLLAGSGKSGYVDGDGPNASFSRPWYIALCQQTGDLFVSDSHNHMIRKVTPQGEVTTLVGGAQGFADGNEKEAKFFCPQGLFFDEVDQSLLVCDSGNNRLRKVLLNGHVFTVCKVPQPAYVTVTTNRTMFVTSTQNKIFKVSRLGPGNYEAKVVAGSGDAKRIDGRPLESSFHTPHGMAVHEDSNSLFVSECGSHAIRKIAFGYST